MFRSSLFVTLVLLAVPGHADKVYRWRDGAGVVHYADTAPPPGALDVERRHVGDRAPDQTYPYAVRAAMRNFPVTLYVAPGCGSGCDRGGAYLNSRGTPYTEVDALDGDNAQTLVTLTGGRREVPVLVVGKAVLRGYDEAAWGRALDAAGYPRTPLPKGLEVRRAAPKALPAGEQLVEARTEAPPEAMPEAPVEPASDGD